LGDRRVGLFVEIAIDQVPGILALKDCCQREHGNREALLALSGAWVVQDNHAVFAPSAALRTGSIAKRPYARLSLSLANSLLAVNGSRKSFAGRRRTNDEGRQSTIPQ